VQRVNQRLAAQDRQRTDLSKLVRNENSPVSIPLSSMRRAHKSLVQMRVDALEERAKVGCYVINECIVLLGISQVTPPTICF